MAVSGSAQPLGAVDALRAADPVMAALIDRLGADSLGDPRRGRTQDHYGSLSRSIIGQQVSTQSAAAIYRRLTDRYGGRAPTPQEVLAGCSTFSAQTCSVGDVGIRRAMMIEYRLPKLPAADQTEQIAEPWRPHRTLACRFLWRSLHATPI